jgi:DNA-binding response OmpR family regulator
MPQSSALRILLVASDRAPSLLFARPDEFASIRVISPAECRRDLPRLAVDAVILDGRISGATQLLQDLRALYSALPILFVAPSADDVIAACYAGANDFVLAPSSGAEVMLRLRLISAAAVRPLPQVTTIGPFRLDRESRTLSSASRSVTLSPVELKMFDRLLLEAGRPVSRSNLERSIWRQSELAEHPTNIAVVYVSYLRRKLARLGDACWITTITNVGYSLDFAGSTDRVPPRPRSRS